MLPPPPKPPDDLSFPMPVVEEATTNPSLYWGAIAVYFVLGLGLCFAPQTLEAGASALQLFPLIVLVGLAYFGEWSTFGKVCTALFWFCLIVLMAMMSFGMVFVCVLDFTVIDELKKGAQLTPEEMFLPGGPQLLSQAFVGVGIAFAVSLLAWLPPVRHLVGLMGELNPKNFVHATAVATVIGLTALFLVPLLVVGEPPMLNVIRRMPDLEVGDNLAMFWALLWFVPAAFLAVHYPGGRTLREACERLGFTMPKWWHWIVFPAVTAGMIYGAPWLDQFLAAQWKQHGWPTTDEKEFVKLIKGAITPVGAILIGFAAGFGEELTIRGVLQPRVGILLSNALFAALHSWQYQWDGVLAVFLIGLILGVVRKFTNTTTAALIHGSYDAILFMQLYFALQAGK